VALFESGYNKSEKNSLLMICYVMECCKRSFFKDQPI